MIKRSRQHLHSQARAKERGVALMLVLIAVGLATILGAAIVTSSSLQAQIKINTASAAEAQYLAESGVNLAIYYLQNPQSAPTLNSDNYYPGQTGISLGNSVAGTVDVTVSSAGSNLYNIAATGWAGADPAARSSRSLTTQVLVNTKFVVKDAALFAGDFDVPNGTTIQGSVRADGMLTCESGATITGVVKASGSNVPGWQVKPTLPATAVPSLGQVNLYIGASAQVPYYTYTDSSGGLHTGKPGAVPATGHASRIPTNPLGIFLNQGDLTLTNKDVIGTVVVVGAGAKVIVNGNSSVTASAGMPALIVPGSIQFQANASPNSLTITGLCWVGDKITTTGGVASNCTLTVNGALMMGSASASVSSDVQGQININYVSDNVQVPDFCNVNQMPQSVKIVHWGM